MVLRERYVRAAASDHLRKVAVHNAETTRKARDSAAEDSVGCRLADQPIDRGAVPGAEAASSTAFGNAIRAPVCTMSVRP